VDCHDVRRLLDAYVDDELAPVDQAAVRAHLDECVTCRHRLTDLDQLGRIVRRIPYYTASETLRVRVVSGRKRAWQLSSFVPWAAALGIVASLVAAGLFMRSVASERGMEARTIAEILVDDHVRALMGEHLLDVTSSDQHTVKPWFQGKLDFSPPVEDLTSLGFPLVGGRVEYVNGKPAAALIYQRRQHTINLFVWPSSDAIPSTDVRSIRGFQVRHWTRSGMSFWAVSDVNAADLATFAQAFQH
jgi:anti-sigma factor RsiW